MRTSKAAISNRSRGAGRSTLLFVRTALLIAFLLSSYLAWVSLSGGSAAGCGPDSSCDRVLQSRWAGWFGVPVSLPAALVYAGLIAASLFVTEKTERDTQRRAWRWIIVLSTVVAASIAWFVGLQVFVLQTFCPLCMGTHLAGFLGAGGLWWIAPAGRGGKARGKKGEQPLIPPRMSTRLEMTGIAVAAVLIAGQVFFPRASFRARAVSDVAQVSPQNESSREITLHGGEFRIDLESVPLIGSRNAPHVIVSLFDYTCHYCRDLHHDLVEVQQTFSNELAIVNLPMPLDAECNPMISQTPAPHRYACDYARLGLAVWRATPDLLPEYDARIFAPAQPPGIVSARQYAEQLVGREALEKAIGDAWIDDQIRTDIALYTANSRTAGSSRMPQMIIGSKIITGPVTSDQLYQMLEETLGLKRE